MPNEPIKTDDQLLDDFIAEHYSGYDIDEEMRFVMRDSFHFAGYKRSYHERRFGNTLRETGLGKFFIRIINWINNKIS